MGAYAYTASIELPSIEITTRSARRMVEEALGVWGWGTHDRRMDVILLANEIVTNAVEYAGRETKLQLELAQADRWLRVSLEASSSVRPIVHEMNHRKPRDPGMQLVANLAQRWGVDQVPGRKRVWFELDAEQPDNQACG